MPSRWVNSLLSDPSVTKLTARHKVISHLHARLTPDFLPALLPELLNVLATSNPTPSAATTPATDRDKEDKERIVRLRPVLRVIAELGLVGAWENARGGKASKGVVNEQVGQEHVFERVKGLVSSFLSDLGDCH